MDYIHSADLKVKLKESENKGDFLDFVRELKKLWNMKVTVISIVIGALGTVTKWLVQGLRDLEIRERVETIKTSAYDWWEYWKQSWHINWELILNWIFWNRTMCIKMDLA